MFVVDGNTYVFDILDFQSGSETYIGMRDLVFKQSHGILLFYSVTDLESFKSIPSYFEQITTVRGDQVLHSYSKFYNL